MSELDSTDLLGLYDRRYYLHGVAGHEAYRRGDVGLDALVNVRRTYALALVSPLRSALDLGAGRGELARHLVERSVAVTLVDYSPAAMEIAQEHVGNHGRARYLTIDATTLAQHVEPASQDAIFLCDVIEHVSRRELREILAACARVLAPQGALALHSPERTSGAVLSRRAVEERHINLMDIEDLREELRRAFRHGDAFTWDGVQVFREPGRCIELFGVARHAACRRTVLPRAPDGSFSFPGELAAEQPFLLRCSVRPRAEGRLHLRLVAAGRGGDEVPLALESRAGEDCVALVASELMPAGWAGVDRLELELDGAATVTEVVLLTGGDG